MGSGADRSDPRPRRPAFPAKHPSRRSVVISKAHLQARDGLIRRESRDERFRVVEGCKLSGTEVFVSTCVLFVGLTGVASVRSKGRAVLDGDGRGKVPPGRYIWSASLRAATAETWRATERRAEVRTSHQDARGHLAVARARRLVFDRAPGLHG